MAHLYCAHGAIGAPREASSLKPQASSRTPQASSLKPHASSLKPHASASSGSLVACGLRLEAYVDGVVFVDVTPA
jgi:hypothetical protein